MREIKFRAWDGVKMIMPHDKAYYQCYLSFCGQIVQHCAEGMECFGGGDRWTRKENLELMQCTGLKDKNGVEIYEGDVLEGSEGALFLCAVGGYFSEKSVGFGVHFMRNGDTSEFAIDADPFGIQRKMKVIGNIHENPELMEV